MPLPPESREQLGARLLAARRRAGLTLTDVGEALGVSKQVVQRYESGARLPSLDRLADLAAVLGMDDPSSLLVGVFASDIEKVNHQG